MNPAAPKNGKPCWSLERKLGLTARAYTVSILINVAVSSACLLMYFRPAFRESDAAFQQQQRLEQVRAIVRQHRSRLQEFDEAEGTADVFAESDPSLPATLDLLSRAFTPRHRGEPAEYSLREAVNQFQSSAGRSGGERLHALATLEARLTEVIGRLADERDLSLARASRAQQWVTGILAVNSIMGAALCVAGLWYVRRWVVQPASILKQAAGQIREGDFAPNVVLPCDDEMGDLGRELAQMASQIRRLQAKLLDRERWVAASDIIGLVESRIRLPLSAIQEAAANSLVGAASDQELANCQERIVATVQRFEAWLVQLRAGLAAAAGEPVLTELGPLFARVSAAVRPALDRHGVTLAVEAGPDLPKVKVDPLQFEHAIISLVTNAVQASVSGQTVTIRAALDRKNPESILLEIIDRGIGIPDPLIDQIFAPFFTTKPEGTGIGLGLSRSIIQNSGGELTVASAPGSGTCFTVRLPLNMVNPGPAPRAAVAETFVARPEFADPCPQAEPGCNSPPDR